ncbi:MAG TPA: hypothetical protein VGV57_12545 [Thermoleophilaceae bacterium]|nr:hypothetical protein [Thermoleophilaceae bacterium]
MLSASAPIAIEAVVAGTLGVLVGGVPPRTASRLGVIGEQGLLIAEIEERTGLTAPRSTAA